MATIRMTGLSGSGIDTQGMINALMEAEKIPMYRLQNENYDYEDKKTAWNDVDSVFSTLKSKTTSLVSYTNWQQMKTTVGDDTIMSATAKYTAQNTKYNVTVSNLAEAHRIGSDSQTDTTSDLNLSGTFTLQGQSVSVDTTDSLEEIRDKINTASQSMDDADKVTASIIDSTLVIEKNNTGSTSISLSDDGADTVLKDLGFLKVADDTIKNEFQAGEDLQATVNGVAVTRSNNTGLNDIVKDVTFDFTKEGSTTLDVAKDTDSIISLIDDFVEAYNNAMTKAEAYAKADAASDDTAVKTGMLQGDSLLRQIQTKSRSIITGYDDGGTLDADFNRLSKIGITTSGEDNRLSVDKTTLENALKSNFDEVEDLFRDYDEGIIRKFEDYMDDVTKAADGSIDRRIESMDNKIKANNDKIADIERGLETYEQQLILQFANMEAAIAQMNQQMGYISGFTGGSQ